jgi:hypothetical protein
VAAALDATTVQQVRTLVQVARTENDRRRE